jgi:hypothetical protein
MAHEIILNDFDQRPLGYQWDEDAISTYPLPIPVVLSSLKKVLAEQLNAVKEGLLYNLVPYILSYISQFSLLPLYEHTQTLSS